MSDQAAQMRSRIGFILADMEHEHLMRVLRVAECFASDATQAELHFTPSKDLARAVEQLEIDFPLSTRRNRKTGEKP